MVWAIPLLLVLIASGEGAAATGVVIEKLEDGLAAEHAGLKPGDLLLAWSAAGAPERAIRSPFDLGEIESRDFLLGPVIIRGRRAGETFAITIPPEASRLGIEARPVLGPTLLETYERGKALGAEGRLDEALALWGTAAPASAGEGLATRCWLLGRVAAARAKRDVESSQASYREAVQCAEALGPDAAAMLLQEQGTLYWRQHGRIAEAAEAIRAAVETRRRGGASAVALAVPLSRLAEVTYRLRRADEALALHRDTIAQLEAEAPGSPALAVALLSWGETLSWHAALDDADQAFAGARTIAEVMAPNGQTMVSSLTGQGGVARARGDFAAAERAWRRAFAINQRLAPDSLFTAISQLNLGVLAVSRGDFDAAEDWYRGALRIAESRDEGRQLAAILVHNQGVLANARGDLPLAESRLRRGLAEFEAMLPGSSAAAAAMMVLGDTLNRRGQHEAALEVLERALAWSEQHVPDTRQLAEVLTTLGDVAAANGDWDAAGRSYTRAHAILVRLAPGTADLAHVLHGLGTVERAQGRGNQAGLLFAQAVEALEVQHGRLGGADEVRSLFASHFFGIYQDTLESLVEQQRVEEAFALLERSRARSLLALMAERDLVLDDVPADVERERREVDAEYERAWGQAATLDASKDAASIEQLGVKLRQLRERQAEIAQRVRETSPRLDQVTNAEAKGLEEVRASLDPGTLFLAYAVGPTRTLLFVVEGPGAGGLETFTIPVGEQALGERVTRWRRAAEKAAPSMEFLVEAQALHDLLIEPAGARVAAARRILISADGPLHRLPFAALRRGGRYLAESKAIALVASGTVHARLVGSRGPRAFSRDLEAFGDAVHGADGLEPLTASRREVEAVARLFPSSAVHLGNEATEARAKGLGRDVRYVHFSSHGLIDEVSPMDSSLVLSAPAAPKEDGENGVLHAWEIVERVRLEAELVTLAACRSGAGKELAGEGLVGLTRAFQIAGARSVLASLWNVGDKSSLELLTAFYRFLEAGLRKDEALQRAQAEAIRRGHHPVRWAGFQLYGDGG